MTVHEPSRVARQRTGEVTPIAWSRQETWNRRCIETTRRGHGFGYFNLLIVREGDRIVLYPHAVADLAIELDDVAADALVAAVTELRR